MTKKERIQADIRKLERALEEAEANNNFDRCYDITREIVELEREYHFGGDQ